MTGIETKPVEFRPKIKTDQLETSPVLNTIDTGHQFSTADLHGFRASVSLRDSVKVKPSNEEISLRNAQAKEIVKIAEPGLTNVSIVANTPEVTFANSALQLRPGAIDTKGVEGNPVFKLAEPGLLNVQYVPKEPDFKPASTNAIKASIPIPSQNKP